MRRTLVLITALGLLFAGAAAPAGADADRRPFTARMSGEVFWAPDSDCLAVNPWGLRTHSAANGNVTHLGETTLSSSHCTPGPGVATYSGDGMEFVAANGDVLYFDYGGVCPTDLSQFAIGDIFSCTVEFDIVGGTGRFTDAEGGGDGLAYLVFLGLGAPTWPAEWVFEGTLGY